ncbi:exocyst complex component 7 [Toxorhynchites rutilus septentrionalis]|uniref:exocyst complex component 7 n=1 Tax=Toxorhynchites rutilus septentrionalis TaxID=329112 RepID=UPI00247A424B|nr:exocyst complex component 7 [Toxorhynchites rutilus septentrionalis]
MGTLENTLQIETKLEKEQTNQALLKDRVEKYSELTQSMSKILNSFEQRLGKLEHTILPVYNVTKNLQKQQQNLDTTLNCLEQVLSHYDASQDVCNLIHQGPSEGNITSFLDGLNKLKKAKDYFLNNNPQSVELENVTSLFNNGCETLNNHLKSLLRKHSAPMKPVDLLDLIYIEEDSSNEDCPSIKQLPTNTREELNVIAQWLDNNLRREYIQIYGDERSEVIMRSLQNLKDHQKSGSWGNEPLKSRYHGRHSDAGVKKSTSARLQQIFERKANKMLMKASQTLGQSAGLAMRKNSSFGDILAAEEHSSDNDQELEKYLVLLLGLQKLLVWERQLLSDIIPSSRHNEVFSRLSQPSIEMTVRDAEAITSRVLRSISRKEWSAALGIFSALKHVQILQPDIDKICDSAQRQQLSGVLIKLQQTGSKALEQFIDAVKNDAGGGGMVSMSSSTISYGGSSSVPKDATVYELTSNTIWFLEQLQEHCDTIGSILQTESIYTNDLDRIASHKNVPIEQKNKALLGIYVRKVLGELNYTIATKSEQYGDLATKQLFKLNNTHYILKSLQRSNLIDIVALTEHDCEKRYQKMIQDLKRAYLSSWSKLLANITPLEDIPKPVGNRVKDKERAIIKERFSSFNKELDDALRTQRAISVPDVLLREGIKRDNAEHIVPHYNAFFEIYSDVHFSKNPEKYVKYRPTDVNAMLNSFFDDTI